MCSINGFIAIKPSQERAPVIKEIIERAMERGRDSFGIVEISDSNTRKRTTSFDEDFIKKWWPQSNTHILISNNRAESTTEYRKDKTEYDCQPFDHLAVVAHNGTIANDKDFNETCNPIIDSGVLPPLLLGTQNLMDFKKRIMKIKGSYSIAYAEKNQLYLATNYKPLVLGLSEDTIYFTSLSQYLPDRLERLEVPPYTVVSINKEGISMSDLYKEPLNNKALILFSGGLDSTVCAKYAQVKDSMHITLLHILYNCRAQEKEKDTVIKLSNTLDCAYQFLDIDLKTIIGGSPLFDKTDLASGVSASEFAHEWVPARNLIMLSLAIGYAESKGFNHIYLGNNLEEAGAYPDNEMIFIHKLQEVIPYAIQNGKRVELKMPLGNLVKHEIVKLGKEIGAPMEETWSCYQNFVGHCGECGPCFMRKKAFKINKLKDKVRYMK